MSSRDLVIDVPMLQCPLALVNNNIFQGLTSHISPQDSEVKFSKLCDDSAAMIKELKESKEQLVFGYMYFPMKPSCKF